MTSPFPPKEVVHQERGRTFCILLCSSSFVW
jgi:hypothetical protein